MSRDDQPDPPALDPAGKLLVAVITPLLIGGAVAVAVGGRNGSIKAWLQNLFSPRTRAMRAVSRRLAAGERPAAQLRGAIVGSGKRGIASVFGPPPAAMLGRARGAASAASFWDADTWYYPIDRKTRSAMAIKFAGNVARDVEFVSTPAAMID